MSTSMSASMQRKAERQASMALTEKEIRELREVFDLMDRDSGGSLGVEEIKQLMEMLGMNVQIEEIEAMVAEIDTNGSGSVDFEEFVLIMSKPKVLPFTREEVRRAFKVIAGDKDPDGFISPDVLERALIKYCSHKVPGDEINRLLSSLDINHKGLIDYTERINLYLGK